MSCGVEETQLGPSARISAGILAVNVGQSPSRKAHFCDRHHIASANTGANHVLVGWAAYAARSMVLPNSAPRWWGFLCAILGNASPQRTMVSPRRVIDQIEENLTIKVSAPFTTCVALSHPQPLKGWHPSAVRARRRGGIFCDDISEATQSRLCGSGAAPSARLGTDDARDANCSPPSRGSAWQIGAH